MTVTNKFIAEVIDRAGGMAFPVKIDLPEGGELNCAGMSLRDWFAGQFAGAILGDREQWLAFIHDRRGVSPEEHVASEAYLLADAMLAERSKPGGEL